MNLNTDASHSAKTDYPLNDVQDNVHYLMKSGADPKKAEDLKIAGIMAAAHRETQQDEIQLQRSREELNFERDKELQLKTMLNSISYSGRSFGILLFLSAVINVILLTGFMAVVTYFHNSANHKVLWASMLAVIFLGQPLTQPRTYALAQKIFHDIAAPLLVGFACFLILKDHEGKIVYVISGLCSVICYHLLKEVRSILQDIPGAWKIFKVERALAVTRLKIAAIESEVAMLTARLKITHKGLDRLKEYVRKVREAEELLSIPYLTRNPAVGASKKGV